MGTIAGKPRGFFEKGLAVDTETTGLAYNSDDPSYDPKTKKTYQIISIGLIVFDAVTLLPVEKLYLEIKHNGESEWDKTAENIHGLSKEYLEEHGVTEEEAVIQICDLILRHFGPEACLHLLGHNVAFDIWFLKRLVRKFDIELKFGNRVIDTNGIGFCALTTYNSDDLFDQIGFPDRGKHNSLEDIEQTLETVRRLRLIFNKAIGE